MLDTSLACLLLEDTALCNHNHVLATELLFKLTDDTALNAVESGKERDGNKDDNGLLASANIDFLSGRDVNLTKFSLKVLNAIFEVSKSLSKYKER